MAEKTGEDVPEKDPDEGMSTAGLPEGWEVPSGRAGGPISGVSRTHHSAELMKALVT